jgi:recombination protein RecA
MSIDQRAAVAERLKNEAIAKYGHQFASTGRTGINHGSIPTGSLLWDYMSGIGGHPRGSLSECFGAPSIGKTTIVGNNALRNAQDMGMLTGVIAIEPDVDEEWLEKHGINLGYNVLARPDNGEEAFAVLHDWIYSGAVDFILFDSIGGIASEKEQESDKPQAYGNSALITWGVKRIAARAWKNNVGVLFINQQRDDTRSRVAGLVDSTGGWAFKHMMSVRTHLKPGKDRYTIKMSDGTQNNDVMVGRQMVATFKKNKKAQALGKSVRFDYFHIESEQYPFGIDTAKDILAAATVSGVFESTGAWIRHPMFPNGKLNGKAKLGDWLADHPEKLPEIRDEVLKVMDKEVAKKAEAKRRAKTKEPELKVV